jgi:beta-carotene hydroxylase
MLPKNPADYRSILWALLMPLVVGAQLTHPHLVPYLAPLSFYFAMAAGTMAHNHNHCPTFKSKAVNNVYANWISVFYGYPAFAWIPTHNLNHHKHVNREGDATITWRHTNRNTWYVALSYFFVSAYYQSTPIKEYIRKAKSANPALHRNILTQYTVWITALVGTAVLSIGLNGVGVGLKTWIVAFGLPSLFGSYSMMWFNYMQHVHADPWSKYNHSRNITGYIFNFMVFNNGFHTVHHANAATHWSQLRKEHEKIADKIDPRLNWRSFWAWVFRGYIMTAFLPRRFETQQIGRAPFDAPEGASFAFKGAEKAAPETGASNAAQPYIDSVEALEAGNNAQIA